VEVMKDGRGDRGGSASLFQSYALFPQHLETVAEEKKKGRLGFRD